MFSPRLSRSRAGKEKATNSRWSPRSRLADRALELRRKGARLVGESEEHEVNSGTAPCFRRTACFNCLDLDAIESGEVSIEKHPMPTHDQDCALDVFECYEFCGFTMVSGSRLSV